jgi:hypothetical protein
VPLKKTTRRRIMFRIKGSLIVAGVLLVFLLSLVVAARGDAAAPTTTRLVTPALQGAFSDVLGCRVVNASTGPIAVEIAAVDLSGSVVDAFTAILVAGDTTINSEQAGFLPLNGGYCVFSGEFRKGDVRASIELIADIRTVAVAPAQ